MKLSAPLLRGISLPVPAILSAEKFLVFALFFLIAAVAHAADTRPFDADWRFLKSDAPGAEAPAFDDAAWRTVNVPHDWSIEGPFDSKNATAGAGAFLPAGVGWYRKHFTVPAADASKRVFIDFDGVMANSDVWINGAHLGKRPYGYVSFRYDLTDHVLFGKPNIIAVRADNSAQPASRWYTGAGIYRHVRLVVANPVHLEQWSTFVTTQDRSVHIATSVVNQSRADRAVSVSIVLAGPGPRIAGNGTPEESVPAGASVEFTRDIKVNSADLWNLDHPALYTATVKVFEGSTLLDEETVHFGIRDFKFDAATGFWLNGKNFKIKGIGLHADGGAMGAAIPLRVWERRLERLKELGVNAIRTAHNPVAPEFLDLCDRMGFLVMDEMFDCWTIAKNPADYHLYFRDWSHRDTADTVRRDRNHPSIVAYSAGNEIRDTPNAELAKSILKGLVEVFHANDPTRPVTQALFRPNVSHDYDNGLADLLDVIGQNYRENEILAAHEAKPTRRILGTENTQGRANWLPLRDNAAYSGQFLWSGIDYLGESRAWPVVAAGSGLLDRTGGFKPIAYERQSWWSEKPMVYMARRVAPARAVPIDPGYEAGPATAVRFPQTLFSDWNATGTPDVEVYSNCEEVELLLNGKSLGVKPLPADASPRNWRVPFEPGTLKALGRNKGQTVATYELRTAGKPAKVVLTADRGRLTGDWDDVSFVTATVVDANGVMVPNADRLISFKLSGPGAIAAVDSADNASHEPFQAAERKVYQGWCVAVVKASGAGRITMSASAPGLAGSSVTIEGVKK
jgi:beta-galactosidase